MRMTVDEAARIVGGVVEGDGGAVLAGAEVDTRRLAPGELYVALPGARRDGHDFVGEALATAAAALVRRDAELAAPPPGRALIRVSDPLAAYHALTRSEVERRGWRIAAITGSVGKTTTKRLLAALIARRHPTAASAGNRNSTLGLPAQLLRQGEEVAVFVAEMGMSRPGELDTLGALAPPSVLLYTRIAPAHTEFFGGVEGVVEAKAELLRHLRADGLLVYNGDDPHQAAFPERTAARALAYGEGRPARLEELADQGLLGTRFVLVVGGRRARVELPLAGRHQADNLLAAAAAASAFDVTPDDVAAAAPGLTPEPHRGVIHRLPDGTTLVDDSYNASPVAVARLLELLADAPGRRVAVLGEMYELGELSHGAHREAGERAAATADLVVAVGGDDARTLAAAARSAGMAGDTVHAVETAEEATELLRRLLAGGETVLVKGSRGVGLDRTVAALLGEIG